MTRSLNVLAFAALTFGGATASSAQELPGVRDGAEGEIAGRLRAFYFNLAHQDWEALTADILAAKVVAHRPMPESLLATGRRTRGEPRMGVSCVAGTSVSINQAVISSDGDWAEAIVPHCAPALGADEFRLIRFAGRWRFVSIHLQQPVSVTAER